jgi:hypothetical protein
MKTQNVSANLVNRYGNFYSGMYAATLPKPGAAIGDEATILNGRDREPAKVVGIEYLKNGAVDAYVLQAYRWRMDPNTEGYAAEIMWDQPAGEPRRHAVMKRGRMKGTVIDALIGHADAFYDRSF